MNCVKRKKGILLVVSLLVVLLLVACDMEDTDSKLQTAVSDRPKESITLTPSITEPETDSSIAIVRYDAFEDLQVSFSGVTGYGDVTVEMSDAMPEVIAKHLKYTVSSTANVSNGEKIKVTVQYDPNVMKANGYEIVSDSFEYTV